MDGVERDLEPAVCYLKAQELRSMYTVTAIFNRFTR